MSDVRALGAPLGPLREAESAAAPPATSVRRATLRRILEQRSAVVGLTILGCLISIALLADVIAPFRFNEVLIGVEEGVRPRLGPCIHMLGCPDTRPEHLMGLDGNVRDVFSRVVYGARVSLTVGFVTVGAAILVGMLIGSVAGFAGGRVDNVLMRLMDVVLAFPALLLALVIVTVLWEVREIGRLEKAMLAVAIVGIPVYARVMRSAVLTVREQDYVTAARALGDSPLNILARRVIPNAITPLIVQGTLGIGTAVLEIAALSFLGLAAGEPVAEWGLMIGRERSQMFAAPHLIFFPGIMLTLTVLGFNLLGDGLRDAFDPRSKI